MSKSNEPVGRSDATRTVRNLAGLAADDVGESDARPPLVLLHGLTFDRTMWQPTLAALGHNDPGRRALAFDLPGHGESPEWAAYDIDSVAHGVHRAVEEAGLDEPVIVGHSLAAIVASVYAGQFPSRGVVNVDQPLQTAAFASVPARSAGRSRSPNQCRAGPAAQRSHTRRFAAGCQFPPLECGRSPLRRRSSLAKDSISRSKSASGDDPSTPR